MDSVVGSRDCSTALFWFFSIRLFLVRYIRVCKTKPTKVRRPTCEFF